MPDAHRSRFPADYAFVVHFSRPYGSGEPGSGRIEHVLSGEARRFDDQRQMMAFVAEVLASLGTVPNDLEQSTRQRKPQHKIRFRNEP